MNKCLQFENNANYVKNQTIRNKCPSSNIKIYRSSPSTIYCDFTEFFKFLMTEQMAPNSAISPDEIPILQ